MRKKSSPQPPQSTIHPSYCFYAAVFGCLVGAVITIALNQPLSHNLIWLFLSLLLLLATFFWPNHFTLVLAFFAGLLLASCRLGPELENRQTLAQLSGQTITISGQLSDDPVEKQGNTIVKLKTTSGAIYAQLSGTYDLMRSDQLTLSGKLSTGFGTFAGSFYRPEVVSISRASPGDLFAQFKQFFSRRLREFIPSPEVDLGLGYLIGERDGLSEEFSEALRAVGMTHIVVASGAHLGIITGIIRKLFGKISRFAGLMFSLLAILAFALVCGFTPSMTRAALVAALSLLVGFVGRQFTPLRLVSLVAAITLLIEPFNLLHLGWQLSFASFFGLLILAPRFLKLLYGSKKPSWLANMLITSFATSLVCAPILIYNFGTISLLSFVANLILLPTLPYAMLLVFLTGATSFLPLLASLFAKLAAFLLDLHIWLVNFLSDKTAFIITLPPGNPLIFLLYLPILAFYVIIMLYDFQNRRRNARVCSPLRQNP